MKKISTIILLFLIVGCSSKTTNIVSVKLDNKLYEVISNDTAELIKKDINPNLSNLVVFSKQNPFLNMLEQTLRISGYSVFVSVEEIILKDTDCLVSYILDTINKTKVDKNIISTLRYNFNFGKKSCSRLYEVSNNNEIIFKSDWYCLGE